MRLEWLTQGNKLIPALTFTLRPLWSEFQIRQTFKTSSCSFIGWSNRQSPVRMGVTRRWQHVEKHEGQEAGQPPSPGHLYTKQGGEVQHVRPVHKRELPYIYLSLNDTCVVKVSDCYWLKIQLQLRSCQLSCQTPIFDRSLTMKCNRITQRQTPQFRNATPLTLREFAERSASRTLELKNTASALVISAELTRVNFRSDTSQ